MNNDVFGSTPGAEQLLLIEDNVADAEFVRHLLDGTNYETTVVPTYAAAARALQDVPFDMAILDLGLPDCEPLEAAKGIVRWAKGVPVVALTQRSDDLAYACLDAGLQDFIRKAGLTTPLLLRALAHAAARARSAELIRRLEIAERQANLGSIASYVAHEVNNQAAFLIAGVELTRAKVEEVAARVSGPDRAALDEAVASFGVPAEAIERIGMIVRQLQTMKRRGEVDDAVTDVSQLVERTVTAMESLLRRSAIVALDIEPGAHAKIEEHKLAQVLLNLLRNAAEALTGDPRTERITVRVQQSSSLVTIIVTDSGQGIRAEDRAHVFRAFYSSKPQGTGLGLAISEELVTGAGGRISVESERGVGTTFTIRLLRGTPAAQTPSPSGAAIGKRRRVLVIDDDARFRSTLCNLLGRHHEVATAGSGAEGLALLASEPFDAILCDLMMPAMDGTAVYAAIRDGFPLLRPRFVLLTGGSFTPEASRLIVADDVPVLHKPCGIRKILAAIESVAGDALPRTR